MDNEVIEPTSLNKWDIWMEGYNVTGNSSDAQLVVSGIEATSFEEAIAIYAKTHPIDESGNSIWGCRLFSNEVEARKSFG